MFSFHAKKRILPLLLVVVVICVTAIESKADAVGFCDPDGPGQCTATVNLTGNVFTITVTNTSPPANGGFLTAIAFNLNAGTVVNNFTPNINFALFGPAPTGWTDNVSPDGTRTHLISATGNDYNGGGNPSGGTPPGGTVTFTLTLASVNGNTEASLFNSLWVRQRGFEDGGSDKDSFTEIPEATSLLLLGTGLFCMAAGIRRLSRKT